MTEVEHIVESWTKDIDAMLRPHPIQLINDFLPDLWAFVREGSRRMNASSDFEIDDAQFRLGLEFPDDYREFLKRYAGMPASALVPASNRFLCPDELGLYGQMHATELALWATGQDALDELPGVYGDNQAPELFSREQLGSCVVISTHEGSGVYLLNPEVSGADWMEAWWLDFSLPGAVRFRTFTDLLRSELRRSLDEVSSTLT